MEAVDQLNTLITRNYDAEEGFKKAAEKAKSPGLKNYFNRRAKMHYDFGHDIKSEIKNLGGEVDKGTSIKGDLHRTWLNIKSAVAGDTDEALVEECLRGQKVAEEDYQEAVNKLGDPLSAKLAVHKGTIVDSVRELKQLEGNM